MLVGLLLNFGWSQTSGAVSLPACGLERQSPAYRLPVQALYFACIHENRILLSVSFGKKGLVSVSNFLFANSQPDTTGGWPTEERWTQNIKMMVFLDQEATRQNARCAK